MIWCAILICSTEWANGLLLDNFGTLSAFSTILHHDPDPEKPETGYHWYFWPILLLVIVRLPSQFWAILHNFWPQSAIFGPFLATLGHILAILPKIWAFWLILVGWLCVVNNDGNGLKWPKSGLKWFQNASKQSRMVEDNQKKRSIIALKMRQIGAKLRKMNQIWPDFEKLAFFPLIFRWFFRYLPLIPPIIALLLGSTLVLITPLTRGSGFLFSCFLFFSLVFNGHRHRCCSLACWQYAPP